MNKTTAITVTKAAACIAAGAVTVMTGVEAAAPIVGETLDTVKSKFTKTAPEAVEVPEDVVVDADAE